MSRSPILSASSIALALLMGVAPGCGSGEAPAPLPRVEAPAPPAPAEVTVEKSPVDPEWVTAESRVGGDATRGERLVAHYECVRCHEGTGQPKPMIDRQCVGCHERVMDGKLPFPKPRLDGWRAALTHYVTTPDLEQVGQVLRPSYLVSFLQEPEKVRPHMEEWMPRLSISEADAKDIAAYLTRSAPSLEAHVTFGDVEQGKKLAAERGCFSCHAFTGAARGEAAAIIPPLGEKQLGAQIVGAPDLRLTRRRVRPDVLARWIEDPQHVAPHALMPAVGLTHEEALDLAAYIMTAPLEPPPASRTFERLPLLDRPVTFAEVSERVLKKSCVHCHAEPDAKGSDPGPGSAGGFGFRARGIALSSYAATQAGALGKDGARHSLLGGERALDAASGSRLVAALLARREEIEGRPSPEVRGMPLGLPPLSAEDIQLVASWVAEGARP